MMAVDQQVYAMAHIRATLRAARFKRVDRDGCFEKWTDKQGNIVRINWHPDHVHKDPEGSLEEVGKGVEPSAESDPAFD